MNKELKLSGVELLTRKERLDLTLNMQRSLSNELEALIPISNLGKCKIRMLFVVDGFLNYNMLENGFSELLTSFQNKVGNLLYWGYEISIAHRSETVNIIDGMAESNSSIKERITGFKFDSKLSNYDQVWILGVNDFEGRLDKSEQVAIEKFMNNGGGVFATGDHGQLGAAMGRTIPRVKDLRYWGQISEEHDFEEVGMQNDRRNDTNQPNEGEVISENFFNQSDSIPQNIIPQMFRGGVSHPLLSISPFKKANGIIDILPDHPHEGECHENVIFQVVDPRFGSRHTICNTVVAKSNVIGGNTSSGKDPAIPHQFTCISAWDGRLASMGRIVVDSTWHHFLNENLNGRPGVDIDGLLDQDLEAIKQYFRNISVWLMPQKFWSCLNNRIIAFLYFDTTIIEASMDVPSTKFEKMDLKDLHSIGSLALDLLGGYWTPANAMQFQLNIIGEINPGLKKYINPWVNSEVYDNPSLVPNASYIAIASIGAGFAFLRASLKDQSKGKKIDAQTFYRTFMKGVSLGLAKGLDKISAEFKTFEKEVN